VAVDVVMPRLGWTMETGKIAEWLKREGDEVRPGETLFTVESDKALQEVEALDGGILRIPPWSTPPGTETPVGTVLAYLVRPGELLPFALDAAAGGALPATRHGGGAGGATVAGGVGDAGSDPPPVSAATPTDTAKNPTPRRPAGVAPPISPRALRIAAELGVDWTMLAGSGRSGRIVERDVRELAAQSAPAIPERVTPLARRAAETAGVDVHCLTAQMPGKRITRDDVDAAARDATTGATGTGDGRARPLGGTRRLIAERMAQSAQTAAPVTLTTDADATELARLRDHVKAATGNGDTPAPSYNDLLARLVALALLEHPDLNSSLSGDAIVRHDAVHMGIAVDTDKGLLVPVVRDAHKKSVREIAAESARLIAQARAGRARLDDLRGSTFTITNLGMYAIDAFTPIINLPECAILGVGRIVARPIVIDEEAGEIAVRKMMALSLTFDHRLVDGAPAARFLQHVKRWIEQPYGWLTM